MQFVACTHADHAAAILEIFNEAIANSTALYDYAPRPFESMEPWFKAKQLGGYPVIGAVDASGHLLGFASYGTFRDRPAYKYSVEHSVYVHHRHRGRGLGQALLQELIRAAQFQQMHVMIGGIDTTNAGSISLHEKLGFSHAGTIPQAGFKFGRWCDLSFYQLTLDTPQNPIDG